MEYLGNVAKGKEKINSTGTQPHEFSQYDMREKIKEPVGILFIYCRCF